MASSAGAPASTVIAAAEEKQTIDTKLSRIVFSNQGAVVVSWTLKAFKDSDGKPLELVNAAGAEKNGVAFQLRLPRPGACGPK